MRQFSEAELSTLRTELVNVADPRLEELSALDRIGQVAFTLRVLFWAWPDIVRALRMIRPWSFPFQFSKLTTAAFSTLVVLIMTAEAWDLGTSQSPIAVVGLSLLALLGTSTYLVLRQHLFMQRHTRRLFEQKVITQASMLLAVVTGMATTYGLLWGTTLILGLTLFDQALIDGWAASLGASVERHHIIGFAGFVATIGLAVGALGASFEEQGYFRHVAYVDEET